MKAMTLRTAHLVFAFCFVLVLIATFTAVGAIGNAQALCTDNSLAEFWTVPYQYFLAQMEPLKPFKCSRFQFGLWWTLGAQLVFILAVAMAWMSGFLGRHLPALIGGGAIPCAMSIYSGIQIFEADTYYTGKMHHLGVIAFWGFFFINIFNGLFALAACELVHSQKEAAAAQAAALSGHQRDDSGSDATNATSTDKGSLSPSVTVAETV